MLDPNKRDDPFWEGSRFGRELKFGSALGILPVTEPRRTDLFIVTLLLGFSPHFSNFQ